MALRKEFKISCLLTIYSYRPLAFKLQLGDLFDIHAYFPI